MTNVFLLKGGGSGSSVVGIGVVVNSPAAVVKACIGQFPGVKRSSSIAISPRHRRTVASISICVNIKLI